MRILLLVLAVIAACIPAATTNADVPSRQPARTGVLERVEASSDLDGRPVGRDPNARATVLVVFASWCPHCREELDILADLRASHPGMRVIGINYKGHEEYDHRGGPVELREYIQEFAPWLRVVPIGDRMFAALGQPAAIPAIYIYDANGRLVDHFDRRERPQPSAAQLEAILTRLGA